MSPPPSLPWTHPPRWLLPDGPDFPKGLLALPQPPRALRILGPLPVLGDRAVAIVGTRHASDGALDFTFQLARDLAQAGLTVVSGGALGIDGAAHEGALVGGGPTLVVLATGLKSAYPPQHGPLFSRVLEEGGALMSEGQDTWAPHPGLFLHRNRLIAALAGATVVVEAPLRSGALSTARWAKRLKRRLFGVPGRPWDPRALGALRVLQEGGEICTSARDVISVRPLHDTGIALSGGGEAISFKDSKELDGESGSVYRCLRNRPGHPDRIARALDIPADRVQELLLSLELGGLVRRRTDGSYCAVVNPGVSE